jgi:hypothetical protein
MAEPVESEESRRKTLGYAFATAVCLVILDTFILGSPTLAIFTLAAMVFWMKPRALTALKSKELFEIRAIQLVVCAVVVVASFSVYSANNHLASSRADEVISAVDKFHSRYERYPPSLNELVPEYIEGIPRAKYTLLFGSFCYNNFEGKPYLMYYGWPPFERLYYHFASKTRTVVN